MSAPPPLARDPWALATLLALVPLVLHSLGAPLGEPFADDFDCLSPALLAHRVGLFEGFGSAYYWRPIGRQLYFALLGPVILDHPRWIVALHVAMLAATALLLYRALRPRWPGPWAAAAASFVLLAESTRMLIAWASHFQDLGALLFGALALHEASRRRLATTLLASLASLLCKEIGLVALLLVPWMPARLPRRERLRWTAALAALIAAWGLAYLAIARHSGLRPPTELAVYAPEQRAPAFELFLWSLENSARAAFSLAARAGLTGALVGVGLGLLVVLALARVATDAPARARLRRALPWAGWGFLWFVLASVPLMKVFPNWSPYRTTFAGVGLGVALTAVFGAVQPALLVALAALRLAAFVASPGAPRAVETLPQDSGAAFDFPKLARLERLMAETRGLLHARYPTLPRGARIGQMYMPRLADYAYGGDQSLELWYRDSTLRWVPVSQAWSRPDTPIAAFLEYEALPTPHLVLLDAEAVRLELEAKRAQGVSRWAESLADLDRADSLERSADAREFRSTVAGARAIGLLGLGRDADAEREANRAIELWALCPGAHYALAFVHMRRGELADADRELDRTLAARPDYPGASELKEHLRRQMASP